MNTKKISLLFFILFSSITCALTDADITDPSKPIIVNRSNPTFTIIVKSNPTTGYSWTIKNYDPNLISPVSHKFIPPENNKLMGAPGYEEWTFKIQPANFITSQTTNIVLAYMRPWEKQDLLTTNFKVIINYAD